MVLMSHRSSQCRLHCALFPSNQCPALRCTFSSGPTGTSRFLLLLPPKLPPGGKCPNQQTLSSFSDFSVLDQLNVVYRTHEHQTWDSATSSTSPQIQIRDTETDGLYIDTRNQFYHHISVLVTGCSDHWISVWFPQTQPARRRHALKRK